LSSLLESLTICTEITLSVQILEFIPKSLIRVNFLINFKKLDSYIAVDILSITQKLLSLLESLTIHTEITLSVQILEFIQKSLSRIKSLINLKKLDSYINVDLLSITQKLSSLLMRVIICSKITLSDQILEFILKCSSKVNL
jgi:hypothetical protein